MQSTIQPRWGRIAKGSVVDEAYLGIHDRFKDLPELTPRFGYIDESGTRDYQKVMTVALIVLEGKFSANKIHHEALNSLVPHRTRPETNTQFLASGMHYCDMSKKQRSLVGLVLSRHPIECFISCHYHETNETSHAARFSIYTKLLITCLEEALKTHRDLVVTIGQQGGWSGYCTPLIKDLQNVVTAASGQRGFRKAKFALQSAAKPGIQLADFYAGATRDHLLTSRGGRSTTPYDLIAHQVKEIKVQTTKNIPKEKG